MGFIALELAGPGAVGTAGDGDAALEIASGAPRRSLPSGRPGRRHLLEVCAENFRVNSAMECEECTGGSTNPAGDDTAGGVETACGCAADERVNDAQTCTACSGGATRPAGDDPLGGETACGCAADERVDANGDCVACTGGSTRDAGDDPLTSGETACACAVDERVAANACVACPVGETRAAGDDPLGVDTFCAAVLRVELLVVNDKRRCDAFAGGTYESLTNPSDRYAAVAAMRLHTAATVASAASIFADATVFSPPLRLVLVGQMDWCEGDAIDVPQA